MTSTAVEPAGGGWEDYLEIFYAPSKVFARRGSRWGGPLLVLVIVTAIVVLGTKGLLGSLLQQDNARVMAEKMKTMTPEQVAQVQKFGNKTGEFLPYFIIVFTAILPFILGIFYWLVGKVVGATQELGAAFMVATFSYFPRILAGALTGLQAAVLPEEKLTGMASISYSPARFLDPAHTSLGVMALAARFDIFILWTTVLLAIGLKVTGKVTTDKAVIAGVIMFLLGSLPALFQMLRS
ncbi:MAG: YIP1 family protein [Gemmatimonadota bacterium]